MPLKTMDSNTPALVMPAYLWGTHEWTRHHAKQEGRRCAESFLESGHLPKPPEGLEVEDGAIVITEGIVDFIQDRPAWRLYMVDEVLNGMCEVLNWRGYRPMCEVYESTACETSWGALYYATAQIHPFGAQRISLRLKGVVRGWNALSRIRYLFKSMDTPSSLDELVEVTCGWATVAWCPEEGGSLQTRLAAAATRMGQASREDSLEAILRQLPLALSRSPHLKHRETLSDFVFCREHFAALDEDSFDDVSAAEPYNVMRFLRLWDKELDLQ